MTNLQHIAGEALNLILHAIHIAIVFFSVLGWLFDSTRLVHFVLLIATLFYWYVIGPIVKKWGGFGYCPVTDLQWELKKKLGHEIPDGGYIKYLVDRIASHDTNMEKVDRVTQIVMFFCLAASTSLLILRL